MLENINDALIDCVKAAGGSKVVGMKIWPAKGLEGATRHLLACLNAERNEKLSPEEVLLLLRLARDRGHHGGIEFIARELSYSEPTPIAPRDEAAQLQREFIQTTRELAKMAERIERLAAEQHTLRSAA